MSEKEQILQPLNKNFKEPKIRFSSFKNDWFLLRIKDILNVKNGKDQKEVEDPNGIYNIYGTGGVIGKTNSFLYDKESVGIGRKGTIDRPFYFSKPFWTVDTLFWSEIKKGYYPKFIYYLFQTINWHKLNQSTGVPSLTSHVIEMQKVYVPLLDEQIKLTNFLDTLDKKIEILEKKISTLKKYKKGLIIYLLTNGIKTEKFVDYIEYISKTSFASGDGKEKGKYPFYINSTDGNYKFTDSYTHEGKHLIVNTGGQAFIQISEEKFSAMADNLIIKIRKNLYGVYYYLKGIESRINYIGFQGTGIRHLDQNWLKRQYVILPPISDKKIEALEENTNNYIKILEIKLKKLHLIKMQLMKDLFI